MEESKSIKLYTQQGISIATFFGGPLAAGYLIRQNFIALDKEREGLFAMILGILFTGAIFVPLFVLPEETIDKIPNQLIPAIYTAIIYGIVQAIQGKDLKKHKEEKRAFQSNWKATGIGFLWMLVLGGILAAYIFTSPDINSEVDMEITQKMELISSNEDKALKIYSMDPNSVSKEAMLNAVRNEGIKYWNNNIRLLDEIKQYDLESGYLAYIDKLQEYMIVRKETYQLIEKSILEDSDKYNEAIQEKNMKVESLLNEIGQM